MYICVFVCVGMYVCVCACVRTYKHASIYAYRIPFASLSNIRANINTNALLINRNPSCPIGHDAWLPSGWMRMKVPQCEVSRS